MEGSAACVRSCSSAHRCHSPSRKRGQYKQYLNPQNQGSVPRTTKWRRLNNYDPEAANSFASPHGSDLQGQSENSSQAKNDLGIVSHIKLLKFFRS